MAHGSACRKTGDSSQMAPYCVSSFLEMEVEETRSTASTKKLQELIRKWSLDRLITPKGLPLVEALGYAQQIASALAGAHAAGIVHRDIKPTQATLGCASLAEYRGFSEKQG